METPTAENHPSSSDSRRLSGAEGTGTGRRTGHGMGQGRRTGRDGTGRGTGQGRRTGWDMGLDGTRAVGPAGSAAVHCRYEQTAF